MARVSTDRPQHVEVDLIQQHISAIRALLDSLEGIAASVIPGAAPYVGAVHAVEGPVLDAINTLTGGKPAVSNPAPAASQSGADTSHQGAADSAGAVAESWQVTDLVTPTTVLFSGTRADCERWADANTSGGFSIRPTPL